MKSCMRKYIILANILTAHLAVILCLSMTPDIAHAKSALSQLASRPRCPSYCYGDIAMAKKGDLQSFIIKADLPHSILDGPFQIWLQTAWLS